MGPHMYILHLTDSQYIHRRMPLRARWIRTKWPFAYHYSPQCIIPSASIVLISMILLGVYLLTHDNASVNTGMRSQHLIYWYKLGIKYHFLLSYLAIVPTTFTFSFFSNGLTLQTSAIDKTLVITVDCGRGRYHYGHVYERHLHKNTERHTAHTIVSWPSPKQWAIYFQFDYDNKTKNIS